MVKRIHFLYFFCFSVLFFPFIEISSNAPSLRPEWFLLFLTLVILPPPTLSLKVLNWFLLLFFSMLFSIFYGVVMLGVNMGFSDIFELLKPLLYFVFFSFARSVKVDENSLTKFLIFSTLMFVSVSLIAIVQYFGGGPLLNGFLSIYAPMERIDIYVNSRATATMSNPNELGMLLTIGYAVTIFFLDFKFPYKLNYTFPFILFFGVIASGSRTALLSTLVVTLYFFFQQKVLGRINLKSLVYLLSALGLVSIFVFANADLFSKTAYRLLLSSDDSAIGSWVARVIATKETLTMIRESPVFGWGVNKIGFTSGDNVDNEYILFLYRYGIVGLIIALGFFSSMKRGFYKFSFASGSFQHLYVLFLTSILLGASIFAYAASIFHSFRLCTLIVVFLGIGAGLQDKCVKT